MVFREVYCIGYLTLEYFPSAKKILCVLTMADQDWPPVEDNWPTATTDEKMPVTEGKPAVTTDESKSVTDNWPAATDNWPTATTDGSKEKVRQSGNNALAVN